MKKLIILPILSLFVFNFTFGQDNEKYAELIKEAWDLYQAKEYLESGQKYAQAFIANRGKRLIGDIRKHDPPYLQKSTEKAGAMKNLNSVRTFFRKKIRYARIKNIKYKFPNIETLIIFMLLNKVYCNEIFLKLNFWKKRTSLLQDLIL
ncbi:hypothetical protein [Proteiniphilum sp. X52]|uniref:hypothetical protein n=1 Tax=Proteiniphilum sp. X52 TaxID=2382159 RepID=UPI000F0A8EC7|nr:hypothetical protein [Proteiniphilum sp. X52]RNC65032.1 hypothetical protein D7D25_09070 [Proteiniphilum sp. X52]